MSSSVKDISGEKFNKLIVLKLSHITNKGSFWQCQCECGNFCVVVKDKLKSGHTSSCGCVRIKSLVERNILYAKHNLHSHPLYPIWSAMMNRCNNINNVAYPNYGGRGIKVCAEWYNIAKFIADMGECPQGLTLERKDNSLGYSLSNCKWATRKEQNNNKRCNDPKSSSSATPTEESPSIQQ